MTVTAPDATSGSLPQGSGTTSGVAPEPSGLVPTQCFVCADDDAEPVAVGQDFDCRSSLDTFLAVRCRGCGLVYLNPAPALHEPDRTPAPGRDLKREVARFCSELGESARVLHITGAEDLHHTRGPYDAVLLVNVLERVADPLDTLKVTRELLRPNGIALIVTPNTEAAVCHLFRGRHWSGYNFPRHRHLFCADALRRATRMAGLEIVSIRTVGAAEVWARSARNAMEDWRLPRWALAALDRAWGVALVAGVAMESWQRLRGKGGHLLATLRPAAE